jgi:hypothetical protein
MKCLGRRDTGSEGCDQAYCSRDVCYNLVRRTDVGDASRVVQSRSWLTRLFGFIVLETLLPRCDLSHTQPYFLGQRSIPRVKTNWACG